MAEMAEQTDSATTGTSTTCVSLSVRGPFAAVT